MNLQPTLENKLILLRPLKVEDFEALYNVAKDPLIWEQHQCKDRHERAVFEKLFKESIESKGALIAIDKSNNHVIGSSRFSRINGTSTGIEIGWSFLSRTYWGGVYNQYVKKLMLYHAFESLEEVIFHIDKSNIRSQRATEKLGGKRVEDSNNKHLLKDPEKNYTYLIRKNDWQRGKLKL